jgi:hypothetical protein
VSGRTVPETGNRPDWPRIVAQIVNAHENRITAAEGADTALDARVDALEAIMPVLQDVGPAWTAATGTAARTALASYAGQTVSNPPTMAEVQAIDDALKALSQALVALITDLKANGALT